MQETCGAVTGAFMVIGLKFGKANEEDTHLVKLCYALVNEFKTKFEFKNNSINCRQLLGYDMTTAEGSKAISDNNLRYTVCVKCIEDAVEIIQEILDRDFENTVK